MHADASLNEREFSLDVALNLGLKEIAKFPYQFELTTIGSVDAASVCRLKSSENEVVIEACGKGGWQSSQVGAIYEVIQEFFAINIDNSFLSSDAKIGYESSKLIANQESLQNDLVFNILKTVPDQKIPCRTYKNIGNNKKITVPLFLSNVTILDEKASILAKYSSDNGHAAGLSTNEALLHAINECIERDSLGILLYNCFFLDNKNSLPIVNKNSLPEELLIHIKNVESDIGSEIVLVDMTSDIGVTSILCLSVNEYLSAPLYGMGASLYSQYAIDRAVSELMQRYWLKKNMASEEKIKSTSLIDMRYQALAMHPKHLRCAKLDIRQHLNDNKIIVKDFSNLYSLQEKKSLENQINYLQDKLKKRDLEVFYCQLKQSEDTGVTVVHTIIPGLEYFWAAAYGQVVAPYKRIRAS